METLRGRRLTRGANYRIAVLQRALGGWNWNPHCVRGRCLEYHGSDLSRGNGIRHSLGCEGPSWVHEWSPVAGFLRATFLREECADKRRPESLQGATPCPPEAASNLR